VTLQALGYDGWTKKFSRAWLAVPIACYVVWLGRVVLKNRDIYREKNKLESENHVTGSIPQNVMLVFPEGDRADPNHEAQLRRVGLPGLLAALHSPLPHSIYIGSQLIRINAGAFGGKMLNGVGRISPMSEIGSGRTEEAGMWETYIRSPSRVQADTPG
jgi:hypothetical protein